MPESATRPQQINTYKVNNYIKVRLIDNVASEIRTDDNGGEQIIYVYDEVVYMLPYRQNIETDIQNSFDIYWNFGVQKQNEKRKSEIVKRLAELDKNVSRVEEDMIEQLGVTVHQSKIDVINEKISLREEYTSLQS